MSSTAEMPLTPDLVADLKAARDANDSSPPDTSLAELDPAPEMPRATTLNPTDLEIAKFRTIANALARARLGLGKCHTAEAYFVKMLLGREHGLPIMLSVNEIDIIDGKATLPARLKVAIIRQRGLGDVRVIESTDERAAVHAWRADDPDRKFTFTCTIDDARARGYLTKHNWKNFPRNMLVHAASSQAVLILYPELFAGIAYTPDELGAETDADGSVVYDAEFADVTPAGFKPAEPTQDKQNNAQAATPAEPPSPDAAPAAAPDAQTAADRAHDGAQAERDGNGQLATPQQIGAARALVAELGLNKMDWDGLLTQHNYLTLTRCPARVADDILDWLRTLKTARALRDELGMTAEQWGAALQRRGVLREAHLPLAELRGMADRLTAKATPFQLQKLGLAPAGEGTAAGNVSPPASAPA